MTSNIITGNYHLVKNLNSSIILNLIRKKAPISGAELAKITRMRPSTIMKILRNLEREGLIVKTGLGESTQLGGRRPTLWEICGSYGYVVGLELEVNQIHGVLLNLNSEIISNKVVKCQKLNTIDVIESKILQIIDDILHDRKISRRHLLGIGIGVSGLVDIYNGKILKTSLIDSTSQPIYLAQLLKAHFDFPIYIENDANTAALAEKWFGNARGVRNAIFMLVVIGSEVFGVGYGLLLNNELYRGANMFAGETIPLNHNLKNFLKPYCSKGSGDTVQIGDSLININDIEVEYLIDALNDKNEIAIQYFRELGKIFGNELVKVVNLLDPEMIIIGGEIAKAGDYLLGPIRRTLEKKIVDHTQRKIALVDSALPDLSVPLGAAALILQKIFQEPVVKAAKY